MLTLCGSRGNDRRLVSNWSLLKTWASEDAEMWSIHRQGLSGHAAILHLSWKHSSSTIFRASAWWRPVRFTSVPQWTLSSKLLHPGVLLLLGGWNTKANPWMHSNQPGIPQRGVCIRISIYCCQGGIAMQKGASTHSIALTFMVDQWFSCLQQFTAFLQNF